MNEELEVKLTYIEKEMQELKSHQRLLAEKVELQAMQQGITDERFKSILNSLDELKYELKSMKEKPSKRWETIITATITSAVGVIIGLLLKK